MYEEQLHLEKIFPKSWQKKVSTTVRTPHTFHKIIYIVFKCTLSNRTHLQLKFKSF